MLQECSCGEPLLDTVSRCPRCGKPNVAYKSSRWRVFWPSVDTLPGSNDAIQLGYYAAFLAAVLGSVMAIVGAGASLAGLVGPAIFVLLGVGIWRKWRVAALLAFVLIMGAVALSLSRGGGVGILVMFIFVGLLNGVRGTFAHARLSKSAALEGAGHIGPLS